MNFFRGFIVVFWSGIAWLTFKAASQEGMVAGEQFISDIQALGWHAQFNIDFLAHLLLMGLWVAWRSGFSVVGIVIGVACVLGGGLVSLLYILVVSAHCRGDIQKLLLGQHRIASLPH